MIQANKSSEKANILVGGHSCSNSGNDSPVVGRLEDDLDYSSEEEDDEEWDEVEQQHAEGAFSLQVPGNIVVKTDPGNRSRCLYVCASFNAMFFFFSIKELPVFHFVSFIY
jgi:hypothetical protein